MAVVGHTTTTMAKWIPEIWKADIEPVAQPRIVTEGAILEWPFTGDGGTLHIPKMQTVTEAALPTAGDEVTVASNTEDYVSLTPDGRYSSVFIPVQIKATALASTEEAYKYELGRRTRKGKEYRILTAGAGLTTNVYGSDSSHVEKTVMEQLIGALMDGDVEDTFDGANGLRGIFHTNEWPRFMAIDKFVDASIITGNRMESGRIGRVLGVDFLFTTNTYTTGGVNYNLVLGPRCLVHAVKFDITVTLDIIPMRAHGLLGMAKYMDGSTILNEAHGGVYKTARKV